MKAPLLAFVALLALALPSASLAAASGEGATVIAKLTEYKKEAEALSENKQGPIYKKMQWRVNKINKCTKQFEKRSWVKKRLKQQRYKAIYGGLQISLVFTEAFALGYWALQDVARVHNAELRQLPLTDPILKAAMEAGATREELSIQFFVRPDNKIISCELYAQMVRNRQWTRKSLAAMLDKAIRGTRTAEEMATIENGISATQAPLQAGIERLRALGATKDEEYLYTNYFSFNATSSSRSVFSDERD